MEVVPDMIDVRIGNSMELIKAPPDKSIDCCVTSPPYFSLRDYKTEAIVFDGAPDCEHEWDSFTRAGLSGGEFPNTYSKKKGEVSNIQKVKNQEQSFCSKCGAWKGSLGLEPSPELYLKHLLDFFDDVKLKLKDEGNLFVNLADSYLDKCLCLIPQRFAIGMVERGWIVRNEIIWNKQNHMPESVQDRLTKAHEVVWHFVKQARYYYDLDAIREPHLSPLHSPGNKNRIILTHHFDEPSRVWGNKKGKNPGDVWSINTRPYKGAHFATFPLELVRCPILSGCPPGGTVLDPFAGSGTVGEFCRSNDRNAILFELQPDYLPLIRERAMLDTPELLDFSKRTGAPPDGADTQEFNEIAIGRMR